MEKIRLRLSKWRKKLFAIITMIVSLVVIMFVGVPIWFPLSPSTGNGSSGPTVYNWTSWLSPLSDGTYGSNQVYPASPTTHFDKVNDTDAGASAPDNATTYIYSGNTANSYDDTYYIANTTLPPGAYNINATVWICAENDITGSYYGRYATDFRVGSTLETGTQTHQTGTPVYLNISTVYATNPVTSAAWVASDFLNNNLQIGARLTTIVHSSIPYYGYCTAAWLIINCTVPLPYVATSPSPVQIGVNTTFVSYWNFSGATCYGSFTGNVTGFTATTTQAMSGQWFNVSFITPTPNNTVIQWAMICNDTANKQWTSGTQTTTLKEMNLQVNYTGDGAYSGYDDVFINSTNTYYSTSQTQQGYDGTAGVNSTYRFRHLPYLTRASTVNHAYLNFTYYSNKASTAWMRITLCVSPSIDGSKVSTAFTLAKVAGYVDWQLPTAQAQNTSVVTSDAASLVTAFLNNSAYSSLSSSMTFVLSYLNGTGIQEFWACNGNATSAAILTVDFNMYPEYESVVETPSVPVSGVSQQLDVQYIYWRNMTQYLYQTNNTGTATNSSLATVTDGVYPYRWANFTYTLNDSNPWIIDNFVYGNSTLGYLSVTEIQLSPLYTNYNSSLLGTIITSTNVYSLTHTTGRRVFYDNNTASWIAWYSDGHNMFYAFSTDGVNWFNKTSLGNILNDANFNNANCTVGDHFYPCVWQSGSTTYVDYEFGYEGLGYIEGDANCSSVFYKRGIVQSNYSITWPTPIQMVYNTTLTADRNGTSPEGIIVDSNGYPYVLIQNCTTGGYSGGWLNMSMCLWKDANNDGTWATASGFPLNASIGHDNFEANLNLMSDNTVVITESSDIDNSFEPGNPGNVTIWLWNNTASSLTYENASVLQGYYRDCHSTVVNAQNTIYIVYLAADNTIRFSYRYANGTWVKDQMLYNNFASNDAIAVTVPQLTYDSSRQMLVISWMGVDNYLYANYAYESNLAWQTIPFRILSVQVIVGGNTAILANVAVRNAVSGSVMFIAEDANFLIRSYNYAEATLLSFPILGIYGTTSTVAGSSCLHYTNWTDNNPTTTLTEFIFGTNNTGHWVNETHSDVSLGWGTGTASGNVTETLNDTLVTVQWEVWVLDSAGVWVGSGLKNFTTTFTTSLTLGWNGFTAMSIDVGHTLGNVNASLNHDSINWTVVTVDYLNGTQWSLVNGTSYNSVYAVTSGSKLWIYITDVADTWTHTYP